MWLKWLHVPDNHLPHDNVSTIFLFREVWENTIQHSSGLSLQYLRMLDGIFPYLPQKNHGNLSMFCTPLRSLWICTWLQICKVAMLKACSFRSLNIYYVVDRLKWEKISIIIKVGHHFFFGPCNSKNCHFVARKRNYTIFADIQGVSHWFEQDKIAIKPP